MSIEVLPNGSEPFFVHGMSLAMTVSAPGYSATVIDLVVPRGRRRPVEVALAPLAWTPAPESPALVRELQVAWTRWLDTSAAWTSSGDPSLLTARNAARVQVASLAEDWAAWSGASPEDRALAWWTAARFGAALPAGLLRADPTAAWSCTNEWSASIGSRVIRIRGGREEGEG